MFDDDLVRSETGVNLFVDYLEDHGWVTDVAEGDVKGWDVRAVRCGKEVYFEVKEDFKWNETGNVAIEYYYRGQPSGIATTTSEYYIYKLGSCFYYARVSELRARLEKDSFTRREGGDGCLSGLYLMSLERFQEAFTLFHII